MIALSLGFLSNFGFTVPNALLIGVGTGLLLVLLFGLMSSPEVIRHYSLRLALWQLQKIPLDYIRFLDYAAERILLRKVGGGYIFVHRTLLEYFASLEDEQE